MTIITRSASDIIRIIEEGPQGNEGRSAYSEWLLQGNVGTEEDFLASLIGTFENLSNQVLTTPYILTDKVVVQRNGLSYSTTLSDFRNWVIDLVSPSIIVAPVISTDDLGRVYMSTVGQWTDNALVTYQWYIDGVAQGVPAYTMPIYSPVVLDAGKSIQLRSVPNRLEAKDLMSNSILITSDLPLFKNMRLPISNSKFMSSADFNLTFTPANWLNSDINDRWAFVNYMYVGTGCPTGYVLGTLPAPAPASGVTRTWSMTGSTAGLSINTSTGQITVSDPSQFTALGSRAVTVTTSDLGSYDITIPITAGAGEVTFIDSVNGIDTNSGKKPHEARKDIMLDGATRCMKYGSTYLGTLTMNRNNRPYGDPSKCATQRPISKATTEGYNLRSAYKPASTNPQGSSGTITEFIDFRPSDTVATIRAMYLYNSTNMIVRGNFFTTSATAFQCVYCNGVSSNIAFRHNYLRGYAGDGFYATTISALDLGYNLIESPVGGVADCIQITAEGSTTKRDADVHIHHNILMQDVTSSSTKGAVVSQGDNNVLVENNLIYGKYFGAGIGGQNKTARNNYVFNSRLPLNNANYNNTWGLGIGGSEPAYGHRYHDNIINTSHFGFTVSGTNGMSVIAGSWCRGDVFIERNMVFGVDRFIQYSEGWTGALKDNIQWSNLDDTPLYKNTASQNPCVNTRTITSASLNGSTLTVNTQDTHQMESRAIVNIEGFDQPEYNVTNAVISGIAYGSGGNSSSFTVQITGSPAAPSGNATMTQVYTATTQTISGNAQQAGSGTELVSIPDITGTCADGEVITLTIDPQAGFTFQQQVVLNGAAVSGATDLTFTIPVGTYLQDDPYRPRNIPMGKTDALNTAEISWIVIATETATGLRSYTKAKWADNDKFYHTVLSYPVFTAAPIISGVPEINQTLTAVNATVAGRPTPSITSGQWYMDNVAVSGATASTYVCTSADIGKGPTYKNTAVGLNGTVYTSTSNTLTAVKDSMAALGNGYFWMTAKDKSAWVIDASLATQSVQEIPDKFGSAKKFVQTVNARMPRADQETINDVLCVNFNGSRCMLSPEMTDLGNGSYTVYAVLKHKSSGATVRSFLSNGVGGSTALATLAMKLNSTSWRVRNNTSAVEISTNVTPGNLTTNYALGSIRNGATVQTLFNGAVSDTVVATDVTSASGLILGCATDSNFEAFIGVIAELVIFTEAHDAAKQLRVKNMINTEWALGI